MALRLAGELGTTRMGIDRIVAVAPPIDLHLCCSNLRKRPNHHYDRYFMKKLVQIATSPDNQISKHHKLDIDPLPKSVLEFDTRVTAPVSGFRDVDDYYTQASAKSVLAKISVPTLIITSQDDPIIPIQQFDDVRMPSNIELWTTRFGGHLGFLSSRKRNDPDRHWMDWRVVENLIEAKVV